MIPNSSTNDPRVMLTLGRTPTACEGQSVIFFANLLSLFFGNRGGAKLLEKEIHCVDSYGSRLLPLVGLLYGQGEHVLVLEREPEPALAEFFHTLELNLPKVQLLTRDDFIQLGNTLQQNSGAAHPLLDSLRDELAEIVDGFVTDETIECIATAIGKRTLSSPDGSHRGNNKLLLYQHLKQSGLPVPPTRLAANRHEVTAALAALANEGHRRAVIKAQVGASGIGLLKTPTDTPPESVPQSFFHEGACLVQAWLEPGTNTIESVYSPSVQIFLNAQTIHIYDLTEQILDPVDSIHQGNESPPPYIHAHPDLANELFRQAGEAATWLHRQGYRGAGSVDFLVTFGKHRTPTTAYVCEINARVTGATYPSVLARHFMPHGAWYMRNLELAEPLPGEQLLERLQRHGELFNLKNHHGILPVNFNLDPNGQVRKGQFLALAEDINECRHLLDTARNDLPVTWNPTHDR